MSYDLYGKKTDRATYRKHIVELRVGNPSRKIQPMKIGDIAKRLNITRMTVHRYINEAINLKEAKTDDAGNLIVNQELKEQKQFEEFSKKHPITNDELINGWISRSRNMGHTGKGVKQIQKHVQALQKFCNELKCNPIQLTIDLETSEKLAQSYFDGLVEGKIQRKSNRAKSSPQSAFYNIRMAIRHFMQFNPRNSIAIPRGYNGILSGRVIGHGNYADIQLTDDEIKRAEQFIIEKYGLDSDIYRVFFVGIESCARKEALLNMNLEWTEDNENDEVTYFMKVIETKTEHILDGKFDKFIQRENTQKSLVQAKRRGLTKLWNDKELTKSQAYDKLKEQLREIYKFLNKLDHYFFEEPFHSLRHIGAHYWLRKTDYNYGFVATIGGWTVIDELKKSYGKMPPNMVLKMLHKAREGLNKL